MKNQHQSSTGEARPFFFLLGMLFLALSFSVIVCSSFFFALNFHQVRNSSSKSATMEKTSTPKQVFTLAVK